MPPTAMAADWQVPVLQTVTQTVPATEDHYRLAISMPPITGEPQEVPRVAIPVTQRWWWWYHSLMAHQHQKGHTVPKQV